MQDNTSNNKSFGIYFFTHLVLILLFLSSPFFLSWRAILILIILYYLQIFLLGNCFISKLEFKENIRNTTFYSHYLSKLGINVDKRKTRLVVDYVIPWLIFFIALIYQL